MLDNIEKLSELRSNYSCFDEQEQPYYHALSLGIEAIKALEQEPILDKIRAEMFEEMLYHSGTGEEVIQAYVDGLKKGLDIIDKYKAESEDKE